MTRKQDVEQHGTAAIATEWLSFSVPMSSGDMVVIPERIEVMLLESEQDRFVAARVVQSVGRRLIARIPDLIDRETPVRVSLPDAVLLGEVLASWQEDGALFAAIQLRHAWKKSAAAQAPRRHDDRPMTMRQTA